MSGAVDAGASPLKEKSWRWPFAFVYLVLPCLIFAAALALRLDPRLVPPQAAEGVLDLRQFDLAKMPANLDGEWSFYWQRLIPPEDFGGKTAPEADGVVLVPESWPRRVMAGVPLPARGYATFRLTVLIDPAHAERLALRLNSIHSAYTLWANGRLIASVGRVASDAVAEQNAQEIRLAALPSRAGEIELVMQTSNFHPRPRSMASIQIGVEDQLRNDLEKRRGLTLLIAGTLLLMGIYHIALFAFDPSRRPPLYLALCALLWAAELLCNQANWPLRLFFPEISGELIFRCFRFSLPLSAAVGFQFFHSLYPQEIPRWALRIFWAVTLVMCALAVAAPTGLIALVLPYYYPFAIAKAAISVGALTLAVRRQRQGALAILSGYMAFLLLALNDMLNDLHLIRTPQVMQVGMLAFMLAQTLALAQRFSRLFVSVETLSHELATRNQALEKEVAERIQAQQDIVAVSESERSRISHELHDGLCQQLTAARLLCLTLSGDESAPAARGLKRLADILDGAGTQAYALARGLWPAEPATNDLRHALAELVQQHAAANRSTRIEFAAGTGCAHCHCPSVAHAFGIAREALINAERHANARCITVALECGAQQLTLTVSDDGIGRSRESPAGRDRLPHGGLGLRIMAYRARMIGGDFRLEAGEAGGTHARCTLPCQTLATDENN